MGKAEWYGAISLNTTILFHGGYCPLGPFVPLKLIWSHGLSFWYDVGSDQFATWWGRGSREVHFLIVRSLGAGTEDPLGTLSVFVWRTSHLKSPTSLWERGKINWPVHWLAASRQDQLSKGTQQLTLDYSTFSYTKSNPFIISLYSSMRKIKAKLPFVKGTKKSYRLWQHHLILVIARIPRLLKRL